MTTAIADRSSNILKKDADGNWYSLPANEVDAFVQVVETEMLAEFMSDEWYDARHELGYRFGSYMRGES